MKPKWFSTFLVTAECVLGQKGFLSVKRLLSGIDPTVNGTTTPRRKQSGSLLVKNALDAIRHYSDYIVENEHDVKAPELAQAVSDRAFQRAALQVKSTFDSYLLDKRKEESVFNSVPQIYTSIQQPNRYYYVPSQWQDGWPATQQESMTMPVTVQQYPPIVSSSDASTARVANQGVMFGQAAQPQGRVQQYFRHPVTMSAVEAMAELGDEFMNHYTKQLGLPENASFNDKVEALTRLSAYNVHNSRKDRTEDVEVEAQ